MVLKKWIFLASSALVYGLALIFSQWLWWGSFIFLSPVLYIAARENISFKEGFFYGFLLWFIAASGVGLSLITMASGPLWLRLIPPFFICFYEGLVTGLCFWLTKKLEISFKWTSPATRLLLWAGSIFLYFYYVNWASLSIFNMRLEGYFLMFPLLPLAEHPALLSFMPVVGKGILLIILFFTNATFALPFLFPRNLMVRFLPVMGLLLWILSFAMAPHAQAPPQWLNRVSFSPTMYSEGNDLRSTAIAIGEKIKDLIKKYPKTELIIFPESTLERVNLSATEEIGFYWDAKHVSKPVNLLLGAVNWEKEFYRNAVYWFYDGKMKAVFNKRHAMPVLEELRGVYYASFLRPLFLGKIPSITPSSNERVPFQIFPEVTFLPYLCSELFFNDSPDDKHPEALLTALCSDLWAYTLYISRLMYLAARFKAMEWRRPILYVSYFHNGYIDKQGNVTPLQK